MLLEESMSMMIMSLINGEVIPNMDDHDFDYDDETWRLSCWIEDCDAERENWMREG